MRQQETGMSRERSRAGIVRAAVALALFPLLFASCATAPPHYRSASPQCLEYAIAACRAAIVEDQLEAGIIIYFPAWGNGESHAVVWIKEKDGRERIYDPSYNIYRTLGKDDVILHKGEGLDLGIYATLLKPEAFWAQMAAQ